MGRKNTLEGFWSRVAKGSDDECWPWTYSLDSKGYGRYDVDRRRWSSHRLAFVLTYGEIPDGLALDHLCRNRACCNPRHLEPVTLGENSLRGESFSAQNAKKRDCPAGHPYSADNTYTNPSGARVCRACRRHRYANRKEAA